MPVRYVIDKERRLVITTGWDRVTLAEIKAHQDQLKNDPDFAPEYNQLIDSAAVTAVDVSIGEAIELARSGHFFSPSSRRAWFATDPFIFGMARLIQAHREIAGAQDFFCVFYTSDEALKCLGLDTLPG